MDLTFIIKVKSLNTFEALLQVRLHSPWLLCLRQNLKQLFVGQEVEAREQRSLGLKISIQTFLDHIKSVLSFLEGLTKVLDLDDLKGIWLSHNLVHEFLPDSVNFPEHGALSWHLLHDVIRREHWLKVAPLTLHKHPPFKVLLSLHQLVFPCKELFFERLDVRGATHGLSSDDVIIKSCTQDFNSLSIKNVGNTFPFLSVKSERFPILDHVLQLVFVGELL